MAYPGFRHGRAKVFPEFISDMT